MGTKQQLLTLLEENRGQSLSGEELAKLLNISRNSIWKAMNALKKEGYLIKSVRNQGYTLLSDNDFLSIEGMLPHLATKEMAEQIHIYTSLESTNKTAKEMAINGCPHGTLVLADAQTAGRGRYGRTFHSPAGGGLYLSIVLQPEHLSFNNPTVVTSLAAVAVCEAIIKMTEKAPKIKWVNDIFLDGTKICGILTEAITDLENQCFQSLIVGIGINVFTPTDEFPDELQAIAGSLYPEGGTLTRNQLAAEIVNQLLTNEALRDEAEIFKRYKAYSLILGQKVTVAQGSTTYEATAMDINHVGHLIVETEAGDVLELSSGEVRIRPNL